jgi:hypothetical protein
MEMRICKDCGKEFELTLDNFYKQRDGYFHFCKACHKIREKKWKAEHPERAKEISRKSQEKNKLFYINIRSSRDREARLKVFRYYSGENYCCACCGETNYEFLAIDHINDNGSKHRKEIGKRSMARWLISNDYPDGFRILCHNCNQSLGLYGYCPHNKKDDDKTNNEN